MKQMVMYTGIIMAVLLLLVSMLALQIDKQYEVRVYDRIACLVNMTEAMYGG